MKLLLLALALLAGCRAAPRDATTVLCATGAPTVCSERASDGSCLLVVNCEYWRER